MINLLVCSLINKAHCEFSLSFIAINPANYAQKCETQAS